MWIFDVYHDICHSVEKQSHMRFCSSGNEICPFENRGDRQMRTIELGDVMHMTLPRLLFHRTEHKRSFTFTTLAVIENEHEIFEPNVGRMSNVEPTHRAPLLGLCFCQQIIPCVVGPRDSCSVDNLTPTKTNSASRTRSLNLKVEKMHKFKLN